MVNTYRLVNPHIEGQFNSNIKAKNSLEAGNIFYKNLSEHFNNSVHKFYFSIHKGSSGNGKYYHFVVKEKVSSNTNEVNFSVKPLTIKNEAEVLDKFKVKLNNFKSKFNQDGGDKKSKHSKHSKKELDSSDSDSDFDSSDNYYRRARTYQPVTQPIYYWWYDPYVYRIDTLYIPTFYSYITPFIELSFKL